MTIETMDRYCPICGKDVAEANFKRFGEWACSEAHADEHVDEVRARKLQMVAPEPRPADRPARRGCCG
jgi:hypothetical protein